MLQAIAGLGVGIYLLFNSTASLVLLMIVVSIYWFAHGLIDLTAVARTGQWTERAWVLASGTIALVVGLVLTSSLAVPEGFHFPHQSRSTCCAGYSAPGWSCTACFSSPEGPGGPPGRGGRADGGS